MTNAIFNSDDVRKIAHILREGTRKGTCFLIDRSDQTVIKRKGNRPSQPARLRGISAVRTGRIRGPEAANANF